MKGLINKTKFLVTQTTNNRTVKIKSHHKTFRSNAVMTPTFKMK